MCNIGLVWQLRKSCKKQWAIVIVTRLTTEWNALGRPLSVASTHSARRSKKLEASFTGVRGYSLRPQRVIREKYWRVGRSARESTRAAAGHRACWDKCVLYLLGSVTSPSHVCNNVLSNLFQPQNHWVSALCPPSGNQVILSVIHHCQNPSENALPVCSIRPPLWSSGGQSSWLQIHTTGFDSRRYRIFWEVVGLERSALSLVTTIKELLGRKSIGSGLEIREYGRKDPSCWPCGTFYQKNLVLTSPKSGGRSIGIVRSRTQAMDFFHINIGLYQFPWR
jgi:hypothetical protein